MYDPEHALAFSQSEASVSSWPTADSDRQLREDASDSTSSASSRSSWNSSELGQVEAEPNESFRRSAMEEVRLRAGRTSEEDE